MSRPKPRYKVDDTGCLYFDGQAGRIYVGHKNMVDKSSYILDNESGPFSTEESRETLRMLWGEEAEQDMMSIYGQNRSGCELCNGYGMWPEDYAPFTYDEISWQLSDPCENCGSHNHIEYFNHHSGDATSPSSPPWEETKSIGFHAAMEKLKRSASCVESSDTQVQKTEQ